MKRTDGAPFTAPKAAAANFAVEKSRKRRVPVDHLDYDTRRAQELGYGCHYGKYKADHPKTRAEYEALTGKAAPKVAADRRALHCPQCNKTFYVTTQHANRTYCSDECRIKAGQVKELNHKPARYCLWCGGEIPRGSHRTRYCCNECYYAAEKDRRNKRKEQKQNDGNV